MMASPGLPPNFRNLSNTARMPRRFRAIIASSSSLRLSSLPEGSPTRVVPPPISHDERGRSSGGTASALAQAVAESHDRGVLVAKLDEPCELREVDVRQGA